MPRSRRSNPVVALMVNRPLVGPVVKVASRVTGMVTPWAAKLPVSRHPPVVPWMCVASRARSGNCSVSKRRRAVAGWIDEYNTVRRHSTDQMLSPVDYEQRAGLARTSQAAA